MRSYFEQKLRYTDDGRLLDENGHAIMMDWETPIMKFQAEHVCRNGGDILNVGFGMGIIDNFIESYPIKSHTIIEPHPDVIKKIMMEDWLKKPHVKVIFGAWADVMPYLPRYDGIYIDTWNEMFTGFIEYSPNLLTPNGILSFFNNPSDDDKGDHLPDEYRDFIYAHFNIRFEEMEIPFIDPNIKQSGTDTGAYWAQKHTTYFAPVLTLKN